MYPVAVSAVTEYQRFRAWLGARLKHKRGSASALAERMGKERNWPGRVVSGQIDPPLSAVLDVTEVLRTSMGDVLKPGVPAGFESIALPVALAEAIRDPVIVAAVEALAVVDAPFRLQMAQGLRMVAKLPLFVPSSVSTGETNAGAGTTKAPKKRR